MISERLHRAINADRLLLRSLEEHLSISAQNGKMENWRKCAHSIIDYIVDDMPPPDSTDWLDWISSNHQARI